MNHTVVVLVGSVHRGVLEALAYAKSLRPNKLIALSVVSDEGEWLPTAGVLVVRRGRPGERSPVVSP